MNKIVELLKNNFPELVRDQEGTYEVDIEKLKLELGKGSNIINEGYSLNWLGQSYSRVLRDCPTTTLIKPDNNHNQLPENINSNNVYIEGDNLEVLKHLKNAYTSKIKMIYIDPPYNTGSDGFVYNDSFNFDVNTFMRLSGLDKEEAEKVLNYTKSKRNSHSAWLTFMYPRLYIARELLKEDGVIFISIDDNEQAQLKLLCDQIFGEENFCGCFIQDKANSNNDVSYIDTNHDYHLVYAKSNNCELKDFKLETKKISISRKGKYIEVGGITNGNKDSFLYKHHLCGYTLYYNESNEEIIPIMDYDIEKAKDINATEDIYNDNQELLNLGYIPVRPPKRNGALGRWTWSFDKMLSEKDQIFMKCINKGKDKEYYAPIKVQYVDSDENQISYKKECKPKSIIKYSSSKGTEHLNNIFKSSNVFESPKNVDMIKYFIELLGENNTILDFFSGSSTTADAVMQLNAEDNGNRKFIMVQLPEEIDEKNSKEAYEFCTKELKQEPIIPTIAKERIKRAAKKIKEENKDKEYINNLDLGFKVYKTIEDDRTDVSQLVLFDVKDGIKTDVDDLDALLTTWMLHDGYDLNTKVYEIMINKYKGYLVEQTLYLLDKGFSTEDLLLLVEKLNDSKTPLINQIILNSSNFGNKVLQEFHENVFSKNSKEAKIVVEDR